MNVLVYAPTEEKSIEELRKNVSLIHCEKVIGYLKDLSQPYDSKEIIINQCIDDIRNILYR